MLHSILAQKYSKFNKHLVNTFITVLILLSLSSFSISMETAKNSTNKHECNEQSQLSTMLSSIGKTHIKEEDRKPPAYAMSFQSLELYAEFEIKLYAYFKTVLENTTMKISSAAQKQIKL